MIQGLHLKNFKCFKDRVFKLGNLTLLCGSNGAGKSSVVQSLLIAQQVADIEPGANVAVALNGPFDLELGSVGDVFCHFADEQLLEISLESEKGLSKLSARVDSTSLEDQYLDISLSGSALSASLRHTDGFNFTYLAAERLGPRDTYAMQSKPLDSLAMGSKGEFLAEILAKFDRREVRAGLCFPHAEGLNRKLQAQVEFWMSEWCPELQIRADIFGGANRASIRIQRKGVTSEWMRPANFGFGVSHSLPIVVAALLTNEGGMLIVDNPESHLHPNGQSAIGQFLARLASSGVQVVVETHSDHVLNGIRLAAALPEHPFSPADAVIYHHDGSSSQDAFKLIEITDSCGLSNWPFEFFDQTEKDLAVLAKLRRKNA